MKKMTMVPLKMWEDMQRWKSETRPTLPPSPQVAHTADLQSKMSNVLENPQLSESEKVMQFGQTLQKFQGSHLKAKTGTILPKPVQPAQNDKIINSVPTTLQRKARLMLQLLEQHPKMSWNDQGEISYAGKRIAGSNIIDLVNDMLRSRKTVASPRGWETFARGLAEVNVPQEAVGNKARWSWMQKHQTGQSETDEEEEEDTFFDTSTDFYKTKEAKGIYFSQGLGFLPWIKYCRIFIIVLPILQDMLGQKSYGLTQNNV